MTESTTLENPVAVPYVSADPNGRNTGQVTVCPFVLCARSDIWKPIFGTAIDDTTSDPRTLDLLSSLIRFTEARTIVEVGTYRGWGTATFAETLRAYDLPGHVWSCDPVDHGVQQIIDQAGLADVVTLVQGTFEHLLAQLEKKMDFCYVDASDIREPSLRLRYTRLALEHMNPGGIVAIDDAAGEWKGSRTLRRIGHLYLPHLRGLVVIAT